MKKMSWVILARILILSGMLLCIVQGHAPPYYTFILKEISITRLCLTKNIMTVNGSFPGPVLRVHRGDTVYVNVYNQGDYGVTLHWHGVRNLRNPWSDGPEYITQCAIPPGSNMTYEVIFSLEEGTLWWHAHSDWTRATVHGAIVVSSPFGIAQPFPKPDEEEIIILASWFKQDVNQMVDYSLQNGQDFNLSNAFSINGQLGDFYPCSNGTTYRLLVDYGKTYLLRIINAATNQQFFFAIAQHNLTVVASDGAYIKPIPTSYIMISPGQTMDVLITTNQSPSYYYMASRAYFSSDSNKFDHTTATAILQYKGNYTAPSYPSFPTIFPGFHDNDAANNFTLQFRSLASSDYPINVPINVSQRMYVTVSVNRFHPPQGSSSHEEYWLGSSLNNLTFVYPHTDILLAYFWNLSGIYNTNFPNEPPVFFNFTGDGTVLSADEYAIPGKATEVKVLNYNETVEIVFQDTNVLDTSMNHPIHLHGYSFYVVGTGYGNFNNETDPDSYNLVDPPLVNTFGVPKDGWLAIRFVADNPGVWFLHCHMERHTTWGMVTALIVKNGDTPETSMLDPPAYMPTCTVPPSPSGQLHESDVSNHGITDEIRGQATVNIVQTQPS
ncbi:unnamed protein product [Camellia sinensis]